MNKMSYYDLGALEPIILRCYSFQLQSTKIHLTKMTKTQRCKYMGEDMDYSVIQSKNSQYRVLLTNPNMTNLLLLSSFTVMI